MLRIFRSIAIFFGTLLILAALVAAYLFTGASNANTRVHYTITLPDPAAATDTGVNTITVRMTIQPGPSPFLDLYLREPVQDGRRRVTGFTAVRGDQTLPHWQTIPFYPDAVRLWNGFSQAPVTITYQVDPLWMKGPDSPRSYLGADFAYIRGMVVLYTPLSAEEILTASFEGASSGFAEAEVVLPEGWSMVSPFGPEKIATPVGNLRNAYFGFGPFAIQDLTMDETPFLLGVYSGLPVETRDALSRQVPVLFTTMQKLTNIAPVSRTCYRSLTILPTEPIHGGAAGNGSLVVEDDLNIIAHEMFHWWNGETIVTTPDANWLNEGFTRYYAAKSMLVSGLWTEAEFEEEMSKGPYVLWRNTSPLPLNLIDASNQLTRRNNPAAYNPVYLGGMLLAYHLDRHLQAQGTSLDAVWLPLHKLDRRVSSQDFLHVLETIGGADLARQTNDFLNGRSVDILQ